MFNNTNVDRHINFAAKLYHYFDIPRSKTESIINDTAKLFKDVIDSLKYDVINALNNFDQENINNIKEITNLMLLIQNGAVCKYFNSLEHT